MKNYLLVLIIVLGTMINVQAEQKENNLELSKVILKKETIKKEKNRKGRKAERLKRRKANKRYRALSAKNVERISLDNLSIRKVEVAISAKTTLPSTDFKNPNNILEIDNGEKSLSPELTFSYPLNRMLKAQFKIGESHYSGEHYLDLRKYTFSLLEYSLGLQLEPFKWVRVKPYAATRLGQVHLKTQMKSPTDVIIVERGYGEGSGIAGRKIEPTADVEIGVSFKLFNNLSLSLGASRTFFLDKFDRLEGFVPAGAITSDKSYGLNIGLIINFSEKSRIKKYDKTRSQITNATTTNNANAKEVLSEEELLAVNESSDKNISLIELREDSLVKEVVSNEKDLLVFTETVAEEKVVTPKVEVQEKEIEEKFVVSEKNMLSNNKETFLTVQKNQSLHRIVANMLGTKTSDPRVLKLANLIIEENKEEFPFLIIDNKSIINGTVVNFSDGIKGDVLFPEMVLKIPEFKISL